MLIVIIFQPPSLPLTIVIIIEVNDDNYGRPRSEYENCHRQVNVEGNFGIGYLELANPARSLRT